MLSDDEDFMNEAASYEEKAIPLCLYNEKVKSKYSIRISFHSNTVFLTFI